MEITKIHRFFSWDFKIRRLVWTFLWIFGCFECVSSMFCLRLLLILNLTNTVLSKTSFGSIFVSLDGVLCAKEIHRLGPMDFKIHTLPKNLRTVTRQLTIYINFLAKLSLCDYHLRNIFISTRWVVKFGCIFQTHGTYCIGKIEQGSLVLPVLHQ